MPPNFCGIRYNVLQRIGALSLTHPVFFLSPQRRGTRYTSALSPGSHPFHGFQASTSETHKSSLECARATSCKRLSNLFQTHLYVLQAKAPRRRTLTAQNIRSLVKICTDFRICSSGLRNLKLSFKHA